MRSPCLVVDIDPPRAGWIVLRISLGQEALDVVASYTPRDSITDFLKVVVFLLDRRPGECTVTLNGEPEEVDLFFGVNADKDEVKVRATAYPDHKRSRGGDVRLDGHCSWGGTLDACLLAVRDFLRRTPEDRYEADWGRPFPSALVTRIESDRAFKTLQRRARENET